MNHPKLFRHLPLLCLTLLLGYGTQAHPKTVEEREAESIAQAKADAEKAAKDAAIKKAEETRKANEAAAKKAQEAADRKAAARAKAKREAAAAEAEKEAKAKRLAEEQAKPEPPPAVVVEPPVSHPAVGNSQAIEPVMRDIPAGIFTMGCMESPNRDNVEGGCGSDEKPAHQVSISAFQMAVKEVTFAEWDACEAAKKCPHADDAGWGRGNRPVINVSWDDITQKYIPWLNQETNKNYRLPTEAEWEYAARGGTDTAYPWGNAIGKGNTNCDNSSCGDKFEYTAPVGSFAANGYGLNDMNGNVWEWCQDWYAGDYYASSPASNPKGAASGAGPVLRGGSWHNFAQYVRSAYRNYVTPDNRNNSNGFRLVLP